MGWAFFWLMVVLKVPIAMLLYLVWWAIQARPDADDGDGGGGSGPPHDPHRPRPRLPRRRGPHGGERPPAPARARAVSEQARRTAHAPR